MSNKIDLTPEEVAAIQSFFQNRTERIQRVTNLAELLHRWERLISSLATGYEDSIYEYKNDLTTRDILERLLGQATESLQAKLLTAILPLDEAFKNSTQLLSRPLARNKPDNWWWWRCIPSQPSPELEADLRSERFLD